MTQDSALTAAFDPVAYFAQSRALILADAGYRPTDLQRAVRRNRKLLNAQRTKHVVVNGDVQALTTPDNDAQLRAVDMIYDLAGVKAPRAQSSSAQAGVEVVIDPASGQVIVRAVTK